MKNDEVPDITEIVSGSDSPERGKRLGRRAVLLLLVIIFAVIIFSWWGKREEANAPQYKTEEARRGGFVVTVAATGNLQPVNKVDVGSELSGIIRSVEADYNDKVKRGDALAKLDTRILESKVVQSRAILDSAEAALLEAKASLEEAQNELARIKKLKRLSDNKVPSDQEVETAEAALKRAEAAEAGAKAKVSEAKATLNSDETNLAKAVIRSPINGIVISRSVEPGQTVAASFQAPVLFTLAEDLAQMELHVDIDEADIGLVKEGQAASFTVDAFPDKKFNAVIKQVRYGSKTSGGVVTYETVLSTDNSELLLRPGMTASADITVNKIDNVILVPNAALRFTPPSNEKGREGGGNLISMLIRPRMRQRSAGEAAPPDKRHQQVWTLKDGSPAGIPIVIGSSDGKVTEVVSGDITTGMQLIVDMNNQADN
ncbi:MAG: efflux RND transporter periplasmic adaptor subunit [Nitrospirae bacterium]|nr:efflux RND transporter periplasmic adaptor subunit [Nitrospirota bacterium]